MSHPLRLLAELEEVLLALPFDNEGMLLSEFDGFAAGLLVCPELILPGEWLPEVWGEENEPYFEDMDQASATLNAVMAHYNRVAVGLAKRRPEYEAVFDPDTVNGELIWELWASGFGRAMRLRPAAWDAMAASADEAVQMALATMFGLISMADDPPAPDRSDDQSGSGEQGEASEEELHALALDFIPEMVVLLNDWTKRRSAAPGPANLARAPMGQPKVGRNDPCPCGSGRKYKKCHGAGD